MRAGPDALTGLIGPAVEGMGYELVGCELVGGGKAGRLLRVYIDREGGVTLDDCAAVSHQVSGLLDVEDPIGGRYDLEVSSPGLDRPLFRREHYDRFRGAKVRIKLHDKIAGRRQLVGTLRGVEDDQVVLELDGECLRLSLEQIDSARLVPEF